MTTYGQRISWHAHGSMLTVSANGYATHEEAFKAAYADALFMGYQKPKWWQFCRWNEIDYEKMAREEFGIIQPPAPPKS
jgi:hypothetical protein